MSLTKWMASAVLVTWLASPVAGAKEPSPAITMPELRAELAMMAANDQGTRREQFQSGIKWGSEEQKEMAAMDAVHLERLKAIFAQFGFPSAAMVGSEGVHNTWLLVQHAGSDPTFMAHALKLAKPRVLSGDLRGADYAKLVDRVRLQQGQKQIYGTQFGGLQGQVKLEPIEDEEHVDQRRAKMGLGPLAKYVRKMKDSLHDKPTPAGPKTPSLIPTYNPLEQ